MAISNTDDHLRNHAFVLEKAGWRLSPLYDVNPVPYGDELSLNVNEDDNRISFELAVASAYRFGIEEQTATLIMDNIRDTVKANWEQLASKYQIARADIEAMRPAFYACYDNSK